MSGGSVPYSTNPAGYNPTTSFAYEPTHQVPSQPGMSRRPSNATVAWNESDSSYQSTPINSVLHPQSHQSAPEQGLNHPPRLHFTVQVPGNQSHSLLESSNSGGINGAPGPGSPMSASPSYQTHLSGNLPQDQSLGSHYLSNRSPQMSPRNSQSHSNLQQHQLGTPSAGGMNAYYGDPGSGSAAPASAIPRVLTYSPSQYALRPHNSSINNSHSSPSANTPKTNPPPLASQLAVRYFLSITLSNSAFFIFSGQPERCLFQPVFCSSSSACLRNH
ncbi:hypothetical protein BY996DRAFT_3960071 [Phakopsora pachyrhizi]|nr:hypothetical protein BY996DRAFT_3960071 [Phakopsora pachyrhizi]